MNEAHLPIAAFGGTFLMMVGLTYFFDHEKDVHWISFLEARMARYATIKGVEIAFVLILILVFSRFLDEAESTAFVHSAIYGLLTFLLVEVLGGLLDAQQETMSAAAKGGLGAFIYLEVLDASFSFDGVIGAFALTQNLFVIAIGLGIGAMYVRSMTIMLVDKGTLAEYRYLEHGAFYAILILSVIMYFQTLVHIPKSSRGLAAPPSSASRSGPRSATTGARRLKVHTATAEAASSPLRQVEARGRDRGLFRAGGSSCGPVARWPVTRAAKLSIVKCQLNVSLLWCLVRDRTRRGGGVSRAGRTATHRRMRRFARSGPAPVLPHHGS